MPLSTGDKLGPYEVIARIGAGGMGEVYRAHDSRTGRDVALKISNDRFSERFEREARAVAALNHPNVCTLYDVGPNYLVMELVDGLTLAELIDGAVDHAPSGSKARRAVGVGPHGKPKEDGGLPVTDALAIARQIADALDAAHEKGVVHRDLKPANIKVRSDGTVKVLDFGLAKALGTETGATVDPADSPTTVNLTQGGMILGTAAYMSPEQARGKPVDKRTDIWAFGAVLYEMVTGRRAFEGDDVSSILASVLKSEPRWDDVPSSVRPLLESCLQKDPRKRLRDIGDAWKLVGETPAPTAPARSSSRFGQLGWMAAGVLGAAAAASLWTQLRTASPPVAQPVVRLDVDLGADVALASLAPPTFSSITISPDGTRIGYVARVSGGPLKLLTRRLDQTTVTELAETGAVTPGPFFSPNGLWIGFWNGKQIVKVPVEGGPVVPLGELTVMTGSTWGDDDNIIVGTGSPLPAALLRMPSNGGAAGVIVDLGKDEFVYTSPHLLPDGKSVLVAVVGAPPSPDSRNTTVEVLSMADRSRKLLVRSANTPRYVSSGHLLYAKGPSLFAVPFDLDRLEMRGTPVVVVDDLAQDSQSAAAQYDVSRTGTLVYRRRPVNIDSATTVRWLDGSGKSTAVPVRPGAYKSIRLSPDGRRLALSIADGAGSDIWIYDFQRDAMTRVTSGGGSFDGLVWSADGQYLFFGSFAGMFWTRTDAVQPQVLMATKSIQFPTSFSSIGSRLAFTQVDGTPQLWTVPIETTGGTLAPGKPERVLAPTVFNEADGALSPDGRWLAYVSNRSGSFQVYVKPTSDSGPGLPVSSGGGLTPGLMPAWSPNGRELLYAAGDRIMTVSYTVRDGAFVAGKATVWATSPGIVSGFDVARDGRVIVVAPTAARDAAGPEHTVVFVQNFFDELRRLAPVGK